jgi:hypothetical protein
MSIARHHPALLPSQEGGCSDGFQEDISWHKEIISWRQKTVFWNEQAIF